jgi:nucleoid-associated protein YgaU
MKPARCVFAFAALVAASTAFAQTGDVPHYGPLREPVPVPGAKPMAIQSIDALKGDGLFYVYGSRMASLKAAATAGEGNRHALTETTNDAKTGAVNGHLDVANFVLNGERRPIGRPNFAIPGPDGSMSMLYSGENPLRVAVTLQAFDVADLAIQPFLRTPDNYPKQEAAKAGSARFPAGSVAYLVVARFLDDVLVLPAKESFTGATNTGQFVGNFSKQIPYCLSYEDRTGARPYAMLFKAGAKKGSVQLYPAKTGTLFCDRASPEMVAEGTWEERTVAGTRAVVLSFPANVDPLDTGVSNVERESALLAFIEPTRGTPGVRPGKLYQAGAKIYDFQYRFNKTAADAVRRAMGVEQPGL